MSKPESFLSALVRIGGGNLANNITILRILLIPAFIACLLYYTPQTSFFLTAAFFTFAAACLTDAVDGWIARKFDQKTMLGSYIDPIADKLLLTSGFLCCSLMTHLPDAVRIPAWVTISVITRDVIIMIGSTLIFLTTGQLRAKPLYISKLTTVFQMLVLACAMLQAPAFLMHSLFTATVIFTVLSGIYYVRIGEDLLR